MKRILTLDLDNVFAVYSRPQLTKFRNRFVRPYTREFFERMKPQFDTVLMNTCNLPEHVDEFLDDLGITGVGNHDWRSCAKRGDYYHKMSGYEQWVGDLLIHVEDGPETLDPSTLRGESSLEPARCLELGFHYLLVDCWLIQDVVELNLIPQYDPKHPLIDPKHVVIKKAAKEDKALERLAGRIEDILKGYR